MFEQSCVFCSTSKLALSLSEIWNERVPCRPRSPLLAADQLVQQFQGPIFFSIFDARPLLSFFSTPSVPLPPELLSLLSFIHHSSYRYHPTTTSHSSTHDVEAYSAVNLLARRWRRYARFGFRRLPESFGCLRQLGNYRSQDWIQAH